MIDSLGALFPIGVAGPREGGALPTDDLGLDVEIELRTGNVFRVQVARPETDSGDGVAAARTDEALAVLCDRRAVENAVLALRAVGQ